MILTYKVKHGRDFSRELSLAKKICSKCKEEKDISEFYTYRRKTPKGYGVKSCKVCILKHIQEYRKKNPEKFKRFDKSARERLGRKYIWAMSSINQHRRRGIKVIFSIKELQRIAEKFINCPLCGIELSWENNKKIRDNSPSMDNIDCKKEIGIQDILIICYNCNRTKGRRTMKEFVDYCNNIAHLHREGISQFSVDRDALKASTDTARGAT